MAGNAHANRHGHMPDCIYCRMRPVPRLPQQEGEEQRHQGEEAAHEGMTMLGYGSWWTAGFSASQWHEVTHHADYGWAEFYFVHAGAEYDNVCQDWKFEVYLLGCRLWLCVADPWGEHPSVLDKTLEEFRGSNPELFKEKECSQAPKDQR